MRMIRYVATSLAICLVSLAGGALAALSPATQPSITSDQAITLATNRITVQEASVKVENRSHSAIFSATGMDFQPRRGPHWSWALSYIGAADNVVKTKLVNSVEPVRSHPDMVAYERDGVIERYVIKRGTIEQQFIIAKPLILGGKDLLVSGRVQTRGILESDEADGWLWRDANGVVSLGQVTVFDAKGEIVPAKMEVAQNSTRILVDGKALASAAYPVTIDPEVGTNDFRVSDVRGSGIEPSDALSPDVAFNPDNNEYLVVWWADEDDILPVNDFEIYGQRIDAETGADLGDNDFRISFMGDDGNIFRAEDPAVTYNSDAKEYFVVWQSDHNEAPLENDEFEIFGRRIGADGLLLGDQTRISFMGGPDGDTNRTAANPDICYNAATQQYLVVWDGDDIALLDDEREIFARIVGADAALVGTDDLRISDMGLDGNDLFAGVNPAVACNTTNGEYYVVWWGDDANNQEMEIYAQRLDSSGAEVGDNDKRLTDMGNTGGANDDFRARFPDVAYNAIENQYLVVWEGDDDVAPLANDEFEIFGQLINAATGAEVGPNDFRISSMGGPDGDTTLGAALPAVTYNRVNNEYVVAWEGDDDVIGNDDFQIFSSVVTSDGTVDSETADMPLSDMAFGVVRTAPNPDTAENAGPALAFNPNNGTYLATWEGEDDVDGMVDDEFEIFGQLVSANTALRITNTDSSVDEGVGHVSVTVERLGDLTQEVTVAFAITGGDVPDYTDLSTVVTFPAGSGDAQTVDVLTVNDDSEQESDETISIALTAPTGGAGLAATDTSVEITIIDNDDTTTPTPTPDNSGDSDDSDDSSSTSPSGDGGGGGCALGSTDGIDPILPMLVLLAGMYFLRRKSTLH